MLGISSKTQAAIAEVAATLAPAVTNSIINETADDVGLESNKSNKVDKIRDLLATLWLDGRRRTQTEDFVVALTVEAYSRALQGKCEFCQEDVERVIDAMRALGLRAGDLSRGEWRTRLKRRTSDPTVLSNVDRGFVGIPAAVGPRRYDEAIRHLSELTSAPISPQQRGRQLELILFEVLQSERLSPERQVVSAGEEIDLAFSIEGHNYLVECKWERDPIGLPPLRDFFGKVTTKAEGTFGILLSMSGFVKDINEKASRGGRLSAVGLSYSHLVGILEGRASWLTTVRLARQHASRRSQFFVP